MTNTLSPRSLSVVGPVHLLSLVFIAAGASAQVFTPVDAGGYVRVENQFRSDPLGRVVEYGTNSLVQMRFDASRQLGSDPGFAPSFASVSQTSWFSNSLIAFTAANRVRSDTTNLPPQPMVPLLTRTNFGVTFDISATTPYAIIMQMSEAPFSTNPGDTLAQGIQGRAVIRNVISGVQTLYPMQQNEIRLYGILTPGRYDVGFDVWYNDYINPFNTYDRTVNYRGNFTIPSPFASLPLMSLAGLSCLRRPRRR